MTELTSKDILLVEDNEDDAELAIHALTKYYAANNIHHVKDGVEALDYLFTGAHSAEIRFILLDVKLPRLNGIEVLERLRSDERTRFVPIVMFSSSQEKSDVLRSYELGANSYVVKPVDFDEYRKTVADVGLYWAVRNNAAKE